MRWAFISICWRWGLLRMPVGGPEAAAGAVAGGRAAGRTLRRAGGCRGREPRARAPPRGAGGHPRRARRRAREPPAQARGGREAPAGAGEGRGRGRGQARGAESQLLAEGRRLCGGAPEPREEARAHQRKHSRGGGGHRGVASQLGEVEPGCCRAPRAAQRRRGRAHPQTSCCPGRRAGLRGAAATRERPDEGRDGKPRAQTRGGQGPS
mmetsp:Transcript_76208/g.198570  ORF Transcript_76208/g.198570 Transcript_76208/m.198570 type:complete len:209 (+) Transcript_76208:238-864(+)